MKRSKFIYIIGSVILGVIALLTVFFILTASGVIDVTQKKLVISSSSAEFVYDGKTHSSGSWQLEDGRLKNGHTAVVTVSGKQTEAGSSENFLSAVIVDENGADVTDYYEIEYQAGTIKVNQRPLTLSSGNKSKVYDGEPLTYGTGDADIKISDGSLVKGHVVSVSYTASVTDAGRYYNTFTPHVLDANGKDKSSNYSITCENGVLEILKRNVTVESSGGEKEYDGEPLVKNVYKLSENALVEGHYEKVTISGSQTLVGESDNLFTAAIFDKDGKDVSNNYDIASVYGTLSVTPKVISVSTEGAQKKYDGTPLTCGDYIKSGETVEGHTLTVNVTGSQTSIGKGANVFECIVSDGNGNDVSGNYYIEKAFGELTVTARGITVTTGGGEKEYDGAPLTEESYSYTDDLLSGHYLTCEIYGSQTSAGEGDNLFNYYIKDGDGNDVSEFYEVEPVYGKLKVNKKPVEIETRSAHWVYDGNEHSYPWYRWASCDDADASSSEPFVNPEGNSVRVEMLASLTDAEMCDNCITSVAITDQSGADAANNYEITFCYGNLYITQRPVTLRADSAEKNYDGSPLSCPTANIISYYGLAEGHTVDYVVSGERTDPGETPNKVVDAVIFSEGTDVSRNYEITKGDGVLRVFEVDTPEKDGNDLDESGSLGGDEGDDKLAVTVKSEINGRIYLRFMSFGNFTGQGWEKATPYTEDFGGFGANYLASVALKNAGFNGNMVSIDVNGSNYLLPYYTDLADCLYEKQKSDVKYSGSTKNPYSCYYITYDYLKDGEISADKLLLGEFSEFEKKYRSYVRETYLTVDDGTKSYFDGAFAKGNFGADSKEIISGVARYIRNAAEYDLEYDKTLDACENAVVSFLRDYKTGVCRHYASAATLLYRWLGIPARYVTGYTGLTKAGEEVELKGKDAHAWVEVYVDGMGWVQIEVTGSVGSEDEGGSGLKRVKPINEYYKYDGAKHSHSGKLQGLSLPDGYTYSARVTGSGVNPGKHACRIESLKIYNNGEDVTERYISENKIYFAEGFVQVYLKEITVTTESANKTYDGSALTCSDVLCEEELLQGHRILKLNATGSQTGVGTSNNTFEIVIVDGNGNDVTDVYKVNGKFGTLSVTHRLIEITAASAEKFFDRTKLEADGYEITSGELADGHTEQVKISGGQIAIGKSENKILSVKILNAEGKDVTENYNVKTVNGWLTVKIPEDL